MASLNKYGVGNRLLLLENAVTELRAENKQLRAHLAGELETKLNDKARVIRDSIRDGIDGAPGRAGRDGVDGQSIVGPQGPPGDVLYVGPAEVEAQLQVLRLKLAKWQAAVQFAYEQNFGRKHQGLQTAIDAVLKTIERQAHE